MAISKYRKFGTASLVLAIGGMVLLVSPAGAENRGHTHGRVCTQTAKLQLGACFAEVVDDHYTAKAFCINEPEDRNQCLRDAREEKREARELCREQLNARRELCGEIGEARYAPDMDPNLFQDPLNPSNPNPYFPLDVENRWVYEEDGEQIVIEIQKATKRIAGIDCIVYRDIVTSDGLLVEATDDWFALRTNGDVEYCGEEVKDYEHFEGDEPPVAELVSIDGRFKVGVELAKSGSSFLGDPVPGTTYRQEWDPGNAEDVGTVLSNSYGYGGADPELDEFVPQELAELMCPDSDCVVIADRSTLDPGAFERKYYARGIGKFLEVKPEDGEFVPLVECNFDPRCDVLPEE